MDLKQAARAELERRGIKVEESDPTKEAAIAELKRRGISLSEPQGETNTQSFARGAKNVLAGGLDALDFVAAPVREAVNLGSKAIGSDYRMQPMGQMTAESIDRATKGYTAPKNKEHKIEEAVQRGVTSLIPGSLTGSALARVPGTIGKVGKTLRSANEGTGRNIAATAATAGTAQHYLNENPNDELGAILAGFGAGLGTHGAASGLTKSGRQPALREASRALSVDPQKIKDFELAGVKPTLADVSNGKVPKSVENILNYLPGSSGVLSKARGAQREQILNALNQGEKGLDLSSLSKLTTKGVKSYKGAKDTTHAKMFGRLETDIEKLKNPRLQLSKVHDVAAELGKHGLDPKEFARTPVGKFLNKIHSDTAVDGIPYYRAKHILDGLNDAITTHGTIGKVTQGRLKHLRNALKDDIEEGLGTKLKELSPESHKNWTQARKSYALYADEDIANINDLLKSGKKGATDAFLNLMSNTKKGAEKADMVLKSLPKKEAHKLVNGITHQLGSYKNEFSPVRWATGFRSLDKSAQDLLLEYLPKGQTKSIQKSVEHLKSTLNEANTSKTSVQQALIDYAKKAAKLGGAAIAGTYTGIPTAALALTGGYGTSKLMTSQKFIKALGEAAKTQPSKESLLLKQIIRSSQTRQHHKKGDVVKKTPANDPIAAIYANTKRGTGDRGKDLAADMASFQNIMKGAKKGSDLYKRAQLQIKGLQGQLDDYQHPDTPEDIAAFRKKMGMDYQPLVADVNGKDAILDMYDKHGLHMLSNEKNQYQDLLNSIKTMNPNNRNYEYARKQLKSMQAQFLEDASDAGVKDSSLDAYNKLQSDTAAARAKQYALDLKRNPRFHVINAANADDKHYGQSNAALKPMQDAMKSARQLNRYVNSDEFKQLDPYSQSQLLQQQDQANSMQKQAMDQYYGLEGQEHTAESARQDQLDKERNDPWNFIKKIPVFGQVMNGLNTITGGAIKSFSHMGSNLATGKIGNAFSDLGEGLLSGGQFVMNPVSSTVQNVGGALADKYLPSVMSSLGMNQYQPTDDSSNQFQQDSSQQYPYSNYNSNQYGDNSYGYDDSGYDDYNGYRRGGRVNSTLKKKLRFADGGGIEIDPSSKYAPSAEDREAMRKLGITKTGKSKYLLQRQEGVDFGSPAYAKSNKAADAYNALNSQLNLMQKDPLAYAKKYNKTLSAAGLAKQKSAAGALDTEDQRQNELYRGGYKDFVIGNPEQSNAGQLSAYLNPKKTEQIWKGDWKSKGYSKDQVLKAYQNSLRQPQQSSPGDPIFKSQVAPGYYNKQSLAMARNQNKLTPQQYQVNQMQREQQIDAMKRAQYADTMGSKSRAQLWDSPEMKQYALETAQQSFQPYRDKLNQANVGLQSELGMDNLSKQTRKAYDHYRRTFANEDLDRREREGQGKYLKNDASAWDALTGIPVLGSIVKGINTVSGGVIRKGTDAGEQLGKGNVGSGLLGLADAGLSAGQFMANPLSSAAKNVAGAVADKFLPQILSPFMQNNDSPGYQDDQSTQDQTDYQQYQSPYYGY